jgi:hypothetical protein
MPLVKWEKIMSFLRYAPVFAALTLATGAAQAAPANSMAPATAAKPAKAAMTPAKPAMAPAKPMTAAKPAMTPRHAAAKPTGRMVTTKTSTGKTITYNCSLAGNATKTACK